jgi:hypothetical protein
MQDTAQATNVSGWGRLMSFCKYGNELFSSVKYWEFLGEQLKTLLLYRDFGPWN